MDNITYIVDGLLLFVMFVIGSITWFDLSGRMKKLNNNQVTTMKFIFAKYQADPPASAAGAAGNNTSTPESEAKVAGGNGTGKPESEILTKVGIFLIDEIEPNSVVTTFKPVSNEFVRIIDLDTWNRVVDSLRTGVMPAPASAAPAAVPGPVGADPAAPAAVQDLTPKVKRKSNPAAIAALMAANAKRREEKAKAKVAAQVLTNQDPPAQAQAAQAQAAS